MTPGVALRVAGPDFPRCVCVWSALNVKTRVSPSLPLGRSVLRQGQVFGGGGAGAEEGRRLGSALVAKLAPLRDSMLSVPDMLQN